MQGTVSPDGGKMQAQYMVASARELKMRGEAMVRSNLELEGWRHKGRVDRSHMVSRCADPGNSLVI